jgi:metal-responsive CopG/Arc/MetJ family transcriptional regulator
MQLSQKISVSLDAGILNFIDRYAVDHAAKGRSAVVAKALHLLQLTEQESYLAEAYALSASQDKKIAAEFEATLADGLLSEQNASEGAHATW